MKQLLFSILLFSFLLPTYAQSDLTFDGVFNLTIEGRKTGSIDVLNEITFKVPSNSFIKITSTGISQINTSTFKEIPQLVSDVSKGMLYLDDIPVTTPANANVPVVHFPIWLGEGTYTLKLVAKVNQLSNTTRVKGMINGIRYKY